MNLSSIFGCLFGVSVMYFALKETGMNMAFFLDKHGMLIVVGGTLAAASISFPFGKILMLVRVFLMRVLGRNKVDYQATISQILELNKKAAAGITALNETLGSIQNDFLKEAVTLVAGAVLTEREIRSTLEQRIKTVETRYMEEANMFRILGRFPPAFGLLATTLGMISVLQKIGSPDSQKLIGPAMSIGLIGTLYGIALANLVFLPIAEALTERTREEVALRKIIMEGACLLKQQVNPITLREALNSHLLPRERVVRKAAA
jgi:chemotaxis protein MotA